MGEPSTNTVWLDGAIPTIKAGPYEARLASSTREIRAAQELRYQVMYAEKGGRPELNKVKLKADIDQWDEIAHHIIVVDHRVGQVVGTLRLVSNLMLAEEQNFYTEQAFNLDKLRSRYNSILELGRFCIDPNGRNGVILMLIWKFAMQFIVSNKVEVMLGCASFPGTDIREHNEVLSYLYYNNLAPEDLMPSPIIEHVDLKETVSEPVEFDRATHTIPTLLKGYLKLGARTSNAAIIDPIFNTTYICIYVDAKSMMSENTTLFSAK